MLGAGVRRVEEGLDVRGCVREDKSMIPPKVASMADCHHCTGSWPLVLEIPILPGHGAGE